MHQPATLLKKETLAQVFSCEFCEIFKNTFCTENLRMTVSVVSTELYKIFRITFSKKKKKKKISTAGFRLNNLVNFVKRVVFCYPRDVLWFGFKSNKTESANGLVAYLWYGLAFIVNQKWKNKIHKL